MLDVWKDLYRRWTEGGWNALGETDALRDRVMSGAKSFAVAAVTG